MLLDVGAEWCGPCKQLKPVLEAAATRSGGALRLVCIDGDKRRQLCGALKIKGYPTVFAVRAGRLVDRFVGVPGQEALTAFVTRALVGTPRPTPSDDELADDPNDAQASANRPASDDELAQMTRTAQGIAGLAALGFGKREKIATRVEAELGALLPADDHWLAEARERARRHLRIRAI